MASREESRSLSYRRLYAARSILGKDAISLQGCQTWRQFDKLFVETSVSGHTPKARYHNLQTCKNIWICPLCSQKVSRSRREIMARIVQEERASRHSMALITYTLEHHNSDTFQEVMYKLKTAHANTRRGKQWESLKDALQFVGGIVATEITHGYNGWHIHIHELISTKEHLAKGNTDEWARPLRDRYLLELDRVGGAGIGSIAFDAICAYGKVSSYVGKWGIVPELLGSNAKLAKGENLLPFQILDKTLDNSENYRTYSGLFREYARNVKGTRQCVPSVNWRSRMKRIESELTDPTPRQVIDDQTWEYITKHHHHAKYLEDLERSKQ